jgi:16S rRNA (guanine966-N2)-methyltransferase
MNAGRRGRDATPRARDARSGANRVRIIGGTHRGRVVRFAADAALRPTPDRVRETLFNWLGQDLAGWRTLEPFAGSGVLSLEALSRGAALAVAIDRSTQAIERLCANADALGLAGLEANRADASAWLAQDGRTFDAIFLDPPFAADDWATLFERARARLAPHGFIYAEAGRALAPPPGLALHRHGRAGQVHYHLLHRAPD